MKNYWLILGGISVGIGTAFLLENNRIEKVKKGELKEDSAFTNGQAIWSLVGGTAVILVGIYGFKK